MTAINSLPRLFAIVLFAIFAQCASAAEPTIQEVYAAAESGRVHEAQQMVERVLVAHPNSAKAHFVNAELLAREGSIATARDELAKAERLAPGLPFAASNSVQRLRATLGASANRPTRFNAANTAANNSANSFPWGLLLLGVGAVLVVVAIMKSIARRAAAPSMSNATPPMYGSPGYGGPGYGGPGYSGYGAPGPTGGMGSGIVGGLMTGAAIGAGLVAGEALAHKLVDDSPHDQLHDQPHDRMPPTPDQNDFGGQDFGINDTSSWDSGGGDMGGGGWD